MFFLFFSDFFLWRLVTLGCTVTPLGKSLGVVEACEKDFGRVRNWDGEAERDLDGDRDSDLDGEVEEDLDGETEHHEAEDGEDDRDLDLDLDGESNFTLIGEDSREEEVDNDEVSESESESIICLFSFCF